MNSSAAPGNEVWSRAFMVRGKGMSSASPSGVGEVRGRVAAGREFREAVREVLAANARLFRADT
jgi:hypothetical protein